MIICPKCKQNCTREDFYNNKSIRNGRNAYCKDCWKEVTKTFQQSLRGKFSRYKRQCRSRNKRNTTGSNQFESAQTSRKIEFNLTLDEFSSFWQEDCHYCGSKIETIGLDRIDPSGNYDIWNVVSCCTLCNRMKGDLSVSTFITHCHKL